MPPRRRSTRAPPQPPSMPARPSFDMVDLNAILRRASVGASCRVVSCRVLSCRVCVFVCVFVCARTHAVERWRGSGAAPPLRGAASVVPSIPPSLLPGEINLPDALAADPDLFSSALAAVGERVCAGWYLALASELL